MAIRKKKAAPKKKTTAVKDKTWTANAKAHWAAYKKLQMQVDVAWKKIKADVKKKASPQALMRDKNNLLLLLGECNYLAGEYMRWKRKR